MTWLLGKDRWHRRSGMPERFEVLAQYNSEKARGVTHDTEWADKMARLQTEFDEWVGNRQ